MNRSNNKSSIKIKDDMFINYRIITQFANTKTRKVTVNEDLVGEAIQGLDINIDSTVTEKIEVSV